MIFALIDNGSLEPAATYNLRGVAESLSAATGVKVHPVSWKHSDRIAPDALRGECAQTLAKFIRMHVAGGEREFVFVPFFISAQGAIGSALRSDLEKLQRELAATPFGFTFTDGLAAGGEIVRIVAERIRETILVNSLLTPPVVVVDHGGPSAASATLRDELARGLSKELGTEIGYLAAASMEGEHPPLLADVLVRSEFTARYVVIAPLFLSPGRHAGPAGDIPRICREVATAGGNMTRYHFTGLVGTHPWAATALAAALRTTLSHVHDLTFA